MEPTFQSIRELRQARLARFRRMTDEQRFAAGPKLFSLAVECLRVRLREVHPDADEAQMKELVKEKLRQIREKQRSGFHGGT